MTKEIDKMGIIAPTIKIFYLLQKAIRGETLVDSLVDYPILMNESFSKGLLDMDLLFIEMSKH